MWGASFKWSALPLASSCSLLSGCMNGAASSGTIPRIRSHYELRDRVKRTSPTPLKPPLPFLSLGYLSEQQKTDWHSPSGACHDTRLPHWGRGVSICPSEATTTTPSLQVLIRWRDLSHQLSGRSKPTHSPHSPSQRKISYRCFSLAWASLEKEAIFSSRMNLFFPFCSGW